MNVLVLLTTGNLMDDDLSVDPRKEVPPVNSNYFCFSIYDVALLILNDSCPSLLEPKSSFKGIIGLSFLPVFLFKAGGTNGPRALILPKRDYRLIMAFLIDGFYLFLIYYSFKSANKGSSVITLASNRQNDFIINIYWSRFCSCC